MKGSVCSPLSASEFGDVIHFVRNKKCQQKFSSALFGKLRRMTSKLQLKIIKFLVYISHYINHSKPTWLRDAPTRLKFKNFTFCPQ